MHSEGLVHVVHGDVVPQLPHEVLRPSQRPADLGDGGDVDEDDDENHESSPSHQCHLELTKQDAYHQTCPPNHSCNQNGPSHSSNQVIHVNFINIIIKSKRIKEDKDQCHQSLQNHPNDKNHLELCKRERIEEDEDAEVNLERGSPGWENCHRDVLDCARSLQSPTLLILIIIIL